MYAELSYLNLSDLIQGVDKCVISAILSKKSYNMLKNYIRSEKNTLQSV